MNQDIEVSGGMMSFAIFCLMILCLMGPTALPIMVIKQGNKMGLHFTIFILFLLNMRIYVGVFMLGLLSSFLLIM